MKTMPLSSFNVVNVKAAPYNAVGDGVTDDTAAIQSAIYDIFASGGPSSNLYYQEQYGVATASAPTLHFPYGIYCISGQINIPGLSFFKITGDGAIIKPLPQSTFPSGDFAFHSQDSLHLEIHNMNFQGFQQAVRLNEYYNGDSTQLTMMDCGFYENTKALSLASGSSVVTIEKCKFYDNVTSVEILAADQVCIKDCWITAGTMSGTQPAQIEKYSAYLLIHTTLLVSGPVETGTVEPAWINNKGGSVTVTQVRQGAETSGGYTLINNFVQAVPLISGNEPNAVIVKDSQCYAVYGNTSTYTQPVIVRYVTHLPNMTVIKNNRGMTDSRIIGFSESLSSTDIQTMVDQSLGTQTAKNIVVEVENNAGGLLYDNGPYYGQSYIPLVLYPYVRNSDSLWPATQRTDLMVQNGDGLGEVQPDDSIVYKFNFTGPEGFNTAFLINYSGCPAVGGSTIYSGGYIGLLRADGFWSDPVYGNSGVPRQSLILETLFNQIGDTSSGSWPGGPFTVEAYWDATGTQYLNYNDTNQVFCIKIAGRDNANVYDRIKVIPLNAL